MKRLIVFFAFFCASLQLLEAQKVYPNYLDGVIYFKLKTQDAIDFTVNPDKTISNSQNLSFLKDMTNEFGIQKYTCPLSGYGDEYFTRYIFVYFDSIYKVDLLLKQLQEKDIIEYTSKEPIFKTFTAPPTDTYYGIYGSKNLKWYLDLINAEGAWGIAKASSNIRVAVVDDAIWGEHVDLQIPDSLQYNAVEGTVGSAAPSYFVDQNNHAAAYGWSHGTHCAGLAGAVTNNGSGIASIGGGVTLLASRSTHDTGTHLIYSRQGIIWAKSKGANVISMSFGSGISDQLSRDVLNSCYEAGIVLVAAAGNDGHDLPHYPAAYDHVISVASTDSDKRLSGFSNYGDWVTIAAPGGYDLSTGAEMFSSTYSKETYLETGQQYYGSMQGTSMACPVAAGLCGLMLSRNPKLTPDQVKEILQKTSVTIPGAGHKIDPNSGLINAYAVMQSVDSTMPKALFTATTPTTGLPDLSVSFTSQSRGSSKYNTSTIASYKWYFQRGTTDTTSTEVNPTITYTAPGIYNVTLVVTDSRGIKDSLTKENYVNVTVPVNPVLLQANKDTVFLGFYNTATSTFNVVSNITGWTIANSNGWFTVTPATGDSNAIVSITANGENPNGFSRTGSIVLTNGTISDTVVVSQTEGLPILNVNRTTTTIPNGGGAAANAISITSNLTWTITNSAPAWLTVSPLSGTGDAILVISAEANTTAQKRIGTIIIKGRGLQRKVTIEQEKIITAALTVSPTSLIFESDSDLVKTFQINSTVDWEIAPGESLVWLEVTPRSGESGNGIVVTVKTTSKNTLGTSRDKILDVAGGGLVRKVTVTQNKGIGILETEKEEPTFVIYPNPFSTSITVENKTAFKIKELSVVDLTGRLLLKKIVVDSSKNTLLELENLTKGIYLLKIEMINGKIQYRKLVKN